MEKELIFELIYQITSLESLSKLDEICSKIFKLGIEHLNKAYKLLETDKEEGKKEFYVGDTYLLTLDQIFGERLGPVMLNARLKRLGINELEFITKIDQGKEEEIDPKLKELVEYYKLLKKWKQACWEPGEKVLEIKRKLENK
ncbi:MAG: hypothetical protein M1355_02565 [Patescibacteria group bacterium]|nr:hypothetical protein [Patescibacteria group bacterium]